MNVKLGTIKNGAFLLFTTALIIVGLLISFNAMMLSDRIENKLLPILGYAIMVLVLFRDNKKQYDRQMNIFIYILFLFAFIASAIRGDIGALETSVTGLLLVVIMKNSFKFTTLNTYVIVAWSTVLASVVIIMMLSLQSYNSQGIMVTFAGVMLLNLMIVKELKSYMVFLCIEVIIIITLSITRSRTSMMSFIVVSVMTYIYLFMKRITIKGLATLFAGLTALVLSYNYLEKLFMRFFINKWHGGASDISSGRTEIWTMVFAKKNLWGNGIDYMNGMDAHNSFIQIMGTNGIIFFLVFLMFMGIIVGKILKVKNKMIYLNFFGAWILVSMFENLDIFTSRSVGTIFLFFVHLVFLMFEEKIDKKSTKKLFISHTI